MPPYDASHSPLHLCRLHRAEPQVTAANTMPQPGLTAFSVAAAGIDMAKIASEQKLCARYDCAEPATVTVTDWAGQMHFVCVAHEAEAKRDLAVDPRPWSRLCLEPADRKSVV